MQDRTTNRSRGFGFVVFDDSASTAAVLSQQAKGGMVRVRVRVRVRF